MTLLEMMYNRRSVRKYTGTCISDEDLQQVLKAGLLSASGRHIRPWEFIVVKDKEMLEKLSEARTGAAGMLCQADAAVVVIADESKTDVWIEDCSITMANMHLMADSLGLGSCWIQMRLREAADGRTSEAYVRDILNVPDTYRVEAILSLGMPKDKADAHTEADLMMEKIHYEKF